MNDAQLLERFSAAYATIDAPAPSAALAELMESGGVTDDGEPRDAVVIPLARPRARVRMRYLVAAIVASFVAVSGLAAAGALPDSLQRQVSSVVSHLGIDLPSPAPDRTQPTTTSSSVPTTGAGRSDTPLTGSTSGAPPVTTAPPAGSSLGDVGALVGGTAPTTLPPSGDGLLPPPTVPQLTLPPVTVPQLTLPPLTLLPLPLPPLPIVGL